MMIRRTENPSAFYTLMAGGLAGTFSWIISFPIDVVKSRLQVDGIDGKAQYKGAIDCMKKSYEAEGAKFFTRGLNSTLMRAFPMNAVCFYVVSCVIKFFDEPKNIGITIGRPEELVIAQSRQQNYAMRIANRTKLENRHSFSKYMIFLDGFHEASCHVDMMDLSDDFREQRSSSTYYYKMNDGILGEHLSDDEMRTPVLVEI